MHKNVLIISKHLKKCPDYDPGFLWEGCAQYYAQSARFLFIYDLACGLVLFTFFLETAELWLTKIKFME